MSPFWQNISNFEQRTQDFALNPNCDREVALAPADAGYAVTVIASNDTPQKVVWIEDAGGVEMRWTGARQVVIAVPPATAIKDVRPRVGDVDVSVVRTPLPAVRPVNAEQVVAASGAPSHGTARVCGMTHPGW